MMTEQFEIRWSDLGSPAEPGMYVYRGDMVWVKPEHIESAGGNPDAVCTMNCFMPYRGLKTYSLASIKQPRG
jgi:hypothetical protein